MIDKLRHTESHRTRIHSNHLERLLCIRKPWMLRHSNDLPYAWLSQHWIKRKKVFGVFDLHLAFWRHRDPQSWAFIAYWSRVSKCLCTADARNPNNAIQSADLSPKCISLTASLCEYCVFRSSASWDSSCRPFQSIELTLPSLDSMGLQR